MQITQKESHSPAAGLTTSFLGSTFLVAVAVLGLELLLLPKLLKLFLIFCKMVEERLTFLSVAG